MHALRSSIVLVLWLLWYATFGMPVFAIHLLFITVPMTVWMGFRNHPLWAEKDWHMPWHSAVWVGERIRKLDQSNKPYRP